MFQRKIKTSAAQKVLQRLTLSSSSFFLGYIIWNQEIQFWTDPKKRTKQNEKYKQQLIELADLCMHNIILDFLHLLRLHVMISMKENDYDKLK